MRVLVRRQGIPGDRPEWVEEVSPQGSRRFRNTNPPEHDPGARRFLVMFNEGDQNFHATVYALDVPDLQRKLKEDKIRRIYGIEELPPHTVESPDMVMVVNAKGERFESAAEKEPRMLLGSNLYEIDQRAYRKVVGDDRIAATSRRPTTMRR